MFPHNAHNEAGKTIRFFNPYEGAFFQIDNARIYGKENVRFARALIPSLSHDDFDNPVTEHPSPAYKFNKQ